MADMASTALHLVNLVMTLILLYIYAQNYRKMKSRYTIGLMLFAGILFLHSLTGLSFDMSMVMYSSEQAAQASLVLEAIKAVSFLVLIWISLE